MSRFLIVGCIVLAIIFAGCSSEPEENSAVVKGQLTVSPAIDDTENYSGIGVTILQQDTSDSVPDTLFWEVTDSSGTFEGSARFPEKNFYSLVISRNGANIGQGGIILADGDSVQITGELPDLENNLEIESREHNAMETFQRVDDSFQRVLRYAQTEGLTQDSIEIDIEMWSDLFWEVYEDHEKTLAGEFGASESVRLLSGWDNQRMMQRLRQLQEDERFVELAASYGKNYLAQSQGLDYSLSYLDTLQQRFENNELKMRIQMERVKLLYDSARVDRAKEQLALFEEDFEDDPEAREWLETITYDLNYLSPGDTLPEFSFRDNGDTINQENLKGTPYILEISPLADQLYQQQYDRTVVIHSIYKNFGLEIITIPLDDSQLTVNAFFDERVQPWPVASVDDFDRDEIEEKFNVKIYPTRFLVDKEGRIVRKYVGREYSEIIQGIKSIIENEENPEQ